MTFRNFLADMEMGDIVFRGEAFTWANNKEGRKDLYKRGLTGSMVQLSGSFKMRIQ